MPDVHFLQFPQMRHLWGGRLLNLLADCILSVDLSHHLLKMLLLRPEPWLKTVPMPILIAQYIHHVKFQNENSCNRKSP